MNEKSDSHYDSCFIWSPYRGTACLSCLRKSDGKRGTGGISCTGSGEYKGLCALETVSIVSDAAKSGGALFRFSRIFSDVLEYDEDYGRNTCRTAGIWPAIGMGAGTLSDSRKTFFLPVIYSAYDVTVSGDDALAISGAQSVASDGYDMGSHCAGGVFYLFGISYVPLFLRNTGRTAGSSKDRRCRGMEDFFGNRSAAWFLRNFLGTGAAVPGVFQYD